VFCELRQGGVLRSSHPASCIYRLVEVPESLSKSLRPRWWVLHILVLDRFAESWMLPSKSLPELCTRNLLSQAHLLAVVGLACSEKPGAAGRGALESENATTITYVVDDSFDDNPGERRRTSANGRFEKTA